MPMYTNQESFSAPTNRLLAALLREEYERLLPNLELVQFPKAKPSTTPVALSATSISSIVAWSLCSP